jgi:hypothetical protein
MDILPNKLKFIIEYSTLLFVSFGVFGSLAMLGLGTSFSTILLLNSKLSDTTMQVLSSLSDHGVKIKYKQ